MQFSFVDTLVHRLVFDKLLLDMEPGKDRKFEKMIKNWEGIRRGFVDGRTDQTYTHTQYGGIYASGGRLCHVISSFCLS